jgi:hypothetical protein
VWGTKGMKVSCQAAGEKKEKKKREKKKSTPSLVVILDSATTGSGPTVSHLDFFDLFAENSERVLKEERREERERG